MAEKWIQSFTKFESGGLFDPSKDSEDKDKTQESKNGTDQVTSKGNNKNGSQRSNAIDLSNNTGAFKLPKPPKPKPKILPKGFKRVVEEAKDKKSNDPNATANILSRFKKQKQSYSLQGDLANTVKAITQHSHDSGVKPLYQACELGHLAAAEHFLKTGSSVDTMNVTDFSTPLHGACKSGHYGVVSLLIEEKANVNCKTITGATPLHICCQLGHPLIVRLLLDNGAEVGAETNDGITPLMFGARFGRLTPVKILTEHKADLFKRLDECNALDYAVMEGHADVADYIQLHMRMKKVKEQADASGEPPPLVAVMNGHIDVLHNLLTSKIDPNAKFKGDTPLLHIATEQGNAEVVSELLRQKADVDAGYKGMSPLLTASHIGALSTVIALINGGASMTFECENKNPLAWAKEGYVGTKESFSFGSHKSSNVPIEVDPSKPPPPPPPPPTVVQYLELIESKSKGGQVTGDLARRLEELIILSHQTGHTALTLATENQDLEAVKYFMARSEFEIDEEDVDGSTALFVACSSGALNLAKLFIDKGFSVTKTKHDGASNLHVAAQKGHVEICRLLIEHHANPNATFQNGITPMMMAARYGKVGTTQVLGENGADPLMLFEDQTAMQYAIEENHADVVSYLRRLEMEFYCREGPEDKVKHMLQLRCDVNSTDVNGASLLHLSSCAGKVNIVKLLLEATAVVDAPKHDFATPLHIACQYGHTQVVKMLVQNKANLDVDTFMGGVTPLMMASRFGHLLCVQHLIEKGADIYKMFEGKRAMAWALEERKTSVVQYLDGIERSKRNGESKKQE